MADVKSVAVRVSAITDDYVAGMKRAGDSTMDMSRVSGVALAAVTAGAVAFAKKSADSYVEYGSSIMKLSRTTGESVETMSKLNFAAQQSGVSTDQLSTGMRFLERNMANGNDKFAALGVTVRDANGQLRSSHSVLLDTADAIKRLGPGAEATAAAVGLFGRSGANLLPMLLRGRQGIQDLEAQAQKYGLVLTQDNIPAIKEAVEAHRNLDASMQGLQVRIGQEVLPVFTKLTEVAADIPGPLMAWGAPILGAVAGLGLLVSWGTKFFEAGKKIYDAASKVVEKVPNVGRVATDAAVAVGAGIAVYEMWNYRMNQAAEGAKHLEDTVNHGNTNGSYEDMVQRVDRISAAQADLRTEISNTSPMWIGYRAELGRYVDQLDSSRAATQAQISMIDQIAAATGKTKAEVKSYLDTNAAGGRSFDSAGEAIQAMSGHLDRATMGEEAYAKAAAASKKEVDEKNQADKDAIDPQVQYGVAQGKAETATRNAASAQTEYMRMVRDAGDVQDNYNESLRKQADADRKVTDAIHAQRDAQQQLNDLLRGPSVDERLNIEQAQISLAEAKRRAAGKTDTDPALERRKNELEVQRAQASLKDAQDAHGKAVDAARKNLDAANTSVADAQRAQTEAAKGVRAASDALADYTSKVADAQQKAKDATAAVATANVDLGNAARNLEAAFNNGNVSMVNNAAVLQAWVDQGKITKDQADALTQAFKDMKTAADEASPDKAGPGAAPVADASAAGPEAVREANANKDNPSITENERSYWQYIASTGHYPTRLDQYAHAAGGPLGEGWNLVGEEGPELIHKVGSSAQVSTARATRGLLVPHPFTALPGGAPGGGAGGGYTHNGNIVIGKATSRTAFDIVWAQRKLALSVGRR